VPGAPADAVDAGAEGVVGTREHDPACPERLDGDVLGPVRVVGDEDGRGEMPGCGRARHEGDDHDGDAGKDPAQVCP